jgi:acyl carrier protein
MRDDIRSLVIECYARAIAERDAESGTTPARTAPTDETPLFGSDAELDSMGLVGLVLDVEEQLADRLAVEVTIMDEKALSRRRSPFRSIGSLTDYVAELAGPAPVSAEAS